jgi:hypothetical protein
MRLEGLKLSGAQSTGNLRCDIPYEPGIKTDVVRT